MTTTDPHMRPECASLTEAEYRAKLSDPTYRHTAQRWRDHLLAYPDLDEVSRRNVAELIAYYEDVEAKDG